MNMSTWPELTALELLVAVADYGSLSAGARAVGMAQPNASRSIARLERQLGVKLLHRATTGATLTAEGLLVVEWARDAVEAAHRLALGVASLRGGEETPLQVSASQTVAEHLLPRWISSLRQADSSLQVEVKVLNSSRVVEDIRAGHTDIGFVESPTIPGDLHSITVAYDELIVVVAPGHPWEGTTVTASQLAQTALVTREAGSGTRVALDAALGRAAISAVEMPTNAAVRVAAQTGTAPAVLSRLAVSESIASGALREVTTDFSISRELRAVWTGPRRLRGDAERFITAIVKPGRV